MHTFMPGTPCSLLSLALRASWSARAVCTACSQLSSHKAVTASRDALAGLPSDVPCAEPWAPGQSS